MKLSGYQSPLRRYEDNPCWERIEIIMQTCGITSVNALAQYLGLKRAENLYRIKRGNNRISLKLARIIHLHFNAYPVPWLLTGESVGNSENEIVSLPLYMQESGQMLNTGDTLNLSASLCKGATLALRRSEKTKAIPGFTILLLKVAEVQLPDRVYFFQTNQFFLGRTAQGVTSGTIIVRHKTRGQTVIETKDIKTIYEVCNILPSGMKF